MLCAFSAVSGFAIAGDKTTYPPQTLRAQGIKKLQITGVNGRLHLTARSGKFFTIQVKHSKGRRGEDWHLSVDRQGEALVFEVFNVATGAKWRSLVRKELWPQFDVEITGPSVPALISWRDGELRVKDWRAPVEATWLSGSVVVSEMRAPLNLQLAQARVEISKHSGRLDLRGESGRLVLNEIDGFADVHWLRGDVVAQKMKGGGRIESTAGQWRLAKLEGAWSAKLGEGSAGLEAIGGIFKGEGAAASWEVKMPSIGEVEILSASGDVRVDALGPEGKIFLSSRDGKIIVPPSFAIEDRDGIKVVERGGAKSGRGQIFVRTQSGSITWR